MTTLVDDLLLLARLDSGRPLAEEDVDLSRVIVDAASDAQAAGRDHKWLLDLPEQAVCVPGDSARLHQVVANLLANARTHTPPGTTVTASLATAGDQALVTVVDDGPGIPAQLQPDIFERFARGDSSRSRAAGSTGPRPRDCRRRGRSPRRRGERQQPARQDLLPGAAARRLASGRGVSAQPVRSGDKSQPGTAKLYPPIDEDGAGHGRSTEETTEMTAALDRRHPFRRRHPNQLKRGPVGSGPAPPDC